MTDNGPEVEEIDKSEGAEDFAALEVHEEPDDVARAVGSAQDDLVGCEDDDK